MRINADKNYQVQGKAGIFAGGDVVRPHLLTTAIGHGAIAADGIDRHLRSEPLDKRPKIDVHGFDLTRKMVEKGLKVTAVSRTHARHRCQHRRASTTTTTAPTATSSRTSELFLGHFSYTPRNRRKVITLTAEQALGNFEERVLPLLEAEAQAEAKRCMSCGQCFECDNCVVYCPQTAVFRVPKAKATTGRYVDTDYDEVHRLPHLQGRLPHRLHPDGARGVTACAWRWRSCLIAVCRRCHCGATAADD